VKAGSLFAGIGGFELAALRLGWRIVWASEIEPFALRVHGLRFGADVRRVGDVAAWEPDPVEDAVDVLMAGWPCQDLSVASLRAGLKGERSGLFFEVVRLARILRPRWLLLENVPGLFSSPPGPFGGRDFTAVLAALDGLGYGLAWRVLDAQFLGVPQRRRRVFLVGRLGAECPASLLFEPEGVPRDPAAGGEARARIAAGAVSRALSRVGGGDDPGANKGAAIVVGPLTSRPGSGYPGTDEARGGHVVAATPSAEGPVSPPLRCHYGKDWNSPSNPSGPLIVNVEHGLAPHGSLEGAALAPPLGAGEHKGKTVVAGAVSSKWAKGPGGPAGDEAYNLVVADPVTARPYADRGAADERRIVADPVCANEQRTYQHCGKHFRTRNVVVAPPAFEEAEGADDDALGADVADTVEADGPGAGADPGAAPAGRPVPDLGGGPAGDAGRGDGPDGGDGQLVLFPRLPGALPRAQDEPGVLAGEDPPERAARSAGGAPAPGDGVPRADVVDARGARLVPGPAPTLRDGGRTLGAGSSHDNTPVVIQDARGGGDQNGLGARAGGPAYTLDAESQQAVLAAQCHGSNVGPMGALREGDGGVTSGVPFVVEPRIGRNGRGRPAEVVPPLKAASGGTGKGDGGPVVVGLAQITSAANRTRAEPGDPATTLAPGDRMAVFGFKPGHFTRAKDGAPGPIIPPLSADADKGDQDPLVFDGLPRRLTPVECERLQSFPDGWTCLCGAVEAVLAAAGIPLELWTASDWRTLRIDGLTRVCRCKDSARYRALGNAVAVVAVSWIMARLDAVEAAA
jgi:site-specific DNA-cytosine methylase